MARNDLNITVDVGISIPVEQAERALKIVEWFLNDNREEDVIEEKKPDGSITLKFKRYQERNCNYDK